MPNLTIKDKSRRCNFELKDALDMHLRLSVELLSTQAALERTESRGSHFRDDHPTRDDSNWLKNIIFYQTDDGVTMDFRNVDMPILKMSELPEYASSDSPWH